MDRYERLRRYSHYSRGRALNFTFDPALPPPDRARDGEMVRFRAAFDGRLPLMTGVARLRRPQADTIVLDWKPTGPAWALGRDFRSEFRLRGTGYELLSSEIPVQTGHD